MTDTYFAAIDLGAESGRVVLARVGERLELDEVHRFSNGPVESAGELHWDVPRLWAEMKQGVGLAAKRAGRLAGIGIDTWGVDFGLLDDKGELLGTPFHYRDARTNGILDKAFAIVPREVIFEQTGIQFMQFNTVFQLLAMRLAESPVLAKAKTLLMMPDLFNYWFTGRICCEFTNATTTQAYDPRKGAWADDLLSKLNIPRELFPEVCEPGTVLGAVRADICEALGMPSTPVIAPATHDTGSAVAAVPAEPGTSWAFLSSGTWSLMGAEVSSPVITEQSLAYNFTNEGGVGGTYRFLKNIMGLWLVQESKRTWERQGQLYSYGELAETAASAKPFTSLVDPDDASFLAPGDMPERIQAFCRNTGQPAPDSPAQIVRVCLESLALVYRQTLERIEACIGRRIEVIHAVGGGTQNELLCQWTADATGRPVVAGPIEATAMGNAVVQAIAVGALPDLAAARRLIARSFDCKRYVPDNTAQWDAMMPRFEQLRRASQ